MTLLLLFTACGAPDGVRYSVPVAPTVGDPHAPPVDTGPPPVPPPPVTPAGPFDCHAYDQDVDGVDLCADCDDTDPSTYPGAPAVCFDGRDNSCGVNDEQPCAFEGVHRLGEVGAEAYGTESVVSITDLWGDTAFIDYTNAFPDAIHSGDLDFQRPTPVVDGTLDGHFIGAGDVDGDGQSDLYYWDVVAYGYVVRTDRVDPEADILLAGAIGTLCGVSGDADGDGVSDLAVEGAGGGEFHLFTHLQPGATYTEYDATAMYSFNDPVGYTYTTFTAAEDIDGDGLVDAVANRYQYYDWTNRDGVVGVSLSPLQGSHTWSQTTPIWDSEAVLGNFLTSTPPTLVDLDDDGRVELLAIGGLETNSEPGLVVVPFDATGNIDSAGLRMAWTDRSLERVGLFGDLDGDDRPELVVSHVGADGAYAASLYPLPGLADDSDDALVTFSLADVASVIWAPNFAAGDLDDDGDPDLGLSYTADGREPQAYYVLYPGGL